MTTNIDQRCFARALGKFEPVSQVLNRLADEIKKDHGRTVLEQWSPMERTAQYAYTVRYSLQHADHVQFGLTFIVTGEDAELLLLRCSESAGHWDASADPGRFDQRVYRLSKINEIETAIQQKVSSLLQTRVGQH